MQEQTAESVSIVLAGFMASGKSTVGEIISEITGRPFFDTDLMVESDAGMKIADVFERYGEQGFRRMEKKAVAEATSAPGRVIALGGGALMDSVNLDAVRLCGVVYLLDVEGTEARRRAEAGPARPLLGKTEAEVRSLLESRREIYIEASDAIIDTGGLTPREVAERVLEDFRTRGADGER